jgi:hypothetical protein
MNQARVKLTGASDAALKGELFDVVHEFYDRSSWWLDVLTLNILPNIVAYDLVPVNGTVIRLAGLMTFDPLNPTSPGTTRGGMMPNPGTVILLDVPGIPQTFNATVVLNVVLPTDTNGFPITDHKLLRIYSTGILDGLLGRMMSQPNKSYSNSSMGVYHLKQFERIINQARVAALRNNAFGSQAWVYPQTFGTFGQRGGVSIGSDTSFTD